MTSRGVGWCIGIVIALLLPRHLLVAIAPAALLLGVLYRIVRWMTTYGERWDSGNATGASQGLPFFRTARDSTHYAYFRRSKEIHADTARRAEAAMERQQTEQQTTTGQPVPETRVGG